MLSALRGAFMVFGVIFLICAAIAFVSSLPDLKRYLQVRQM